jgi:hypothetical protein
MERAARLRGFFHDAFTRVFDALWAVSRRAWTKIAKTTPCKVERPPDCSTRAARFRTREEKRYHCGLSQGALINRARLLRA